MNGNGPKLTLKRLRSANEIRPQFGTAIRFLVQPNQVVRRLRLTTNAPSAESSVAHSSSESYSCNSYFPPAKFIFAEIADSKVPRPRSPNIKEIKINLSHGSCLIFPAV